LQKKSEALNALQIFCSHKLLTGADYRREEFEISKLRLTVMEYLKSKSIGIDIFYKTFMLAISVGEFEWAGEFVKTFADHLPGKFQNNAIHYSNARLLYQKKEFERSLQELSKISSFSFVHYKPAVKILQMMIFYDIRHLAEAEDAANAFIQFLRQDKLIPDQHKKAYRDFIKFYLMIVSAASSGKQAKISDIRATINKEKGFLIGIQWFLEKSNELEKR
jgi:hypothetical protein